MGYFGTREEMMGYADYGLGKLKMPLQIAAFLVL